MGAVPDAVKVESVMLLRKQGMSYADIARLKGVSRQAVRQMALRAAVRNEAVESPS
jgi:DNA-directed RNA polymerase specialized sigma24 family protein